MATVEGLCRASMAGWWFVCGGIAIGRRRHSLMSTEVCRCIYRCHVDSNTPPSTPSIRPGEMSLKKKKKSLDRAGGSHGNTLLSVLHRYPSIAPS